MEKQVDTLGGQVEKQVDILGRQVEKQVDTLGREFLKQAHKYPSDMAIGHPLLRNVDSFNTAIAKSCRYISS